MPKFTAHNGPVPTSAMMPDLTLTTSITTLLQLATPATKGISIFEWWVDFAGTDANTPVPWALVRMANLTTPATVTAYNAADITKVNNPLGEASLVTLGTTASGYNASNEGTLSSPINLVQSKTPPSGGIYYWRPEGERFRVEPSSMARFRVHAGTAVGVTSGWSWIE